MNNFDLKKYLKEGKLHENNEYKESINITPQQKSDFINQIKSFMEDEDFDTAMGNAGSILGRILTNDEAEFIEDVEDFGYDPSEVEDYAEDLVGNLNRGKLNENKDTLSQLIMLLSNAIPLADDLMEDENVGEMYDFAELSQQLENFVDDLKNYLAEGKLHENEMESDIVSFLRSNKNELLQTLASKFNWDEDGMEEYSGMDIEMADEGVAGLGEGGLDFSFDENKVADEFGDASTFEIEVAGKPVYGISYNF